MWKNKMNNFQLVIFEFEHFFGSTVFPLWTDGCVSDAWVMCVYARTYVCMNV